VEDGSALQTLLLQPGSPPIYACALANAQAARLTADQRGAGFNPTTTFGVRQPHIERIAVIRLYGFTIEVSFSEVNVPIGKPLALYK
jgi:uncharacterized protein (DUF111 family)